MVTILYSNENFNGTNGFCSAPVHLEWTPFLMAKRTRENTRGKQLLRFQGLKKSIRNHSDAWELSVRIYA
jgi:hypothetical protein